MHIDVVTVYKGMYRIKKKKNSYSNTARTNEIVKTKRH